MVNVVGLNENISWERIGKPSLPLVGAAEPVWPQDWPVLPGSAEPPFDSGPHSAPDSVSETAALPPCCEARPTLDTLLHDP